MNIGIDFYDTITDNPSKFRRYIKARTLAGDRVYVISAIHGENIDRLRKDFKHARNSGALIPVAYINYSDVPRLKYDVCRRLDIDYMIDDRQDICDYMASKGINTKHYKGWREFNGK